MARFSAINLLSRLPSPRVVNAAVLPGVFRYFLVLASSLVPMVGFAQIIDDEDPSVAEPADNGSIASQVPAVAKSSLAESDEDVSWGMPPMPWRGQLGLSSSVSRTGSGSSSSSFSKSLSGSTSSYIWQPWFVGLGGSFSVSQADTSSNQGKSTSDSFFGGLNAQVLSQSRYPAIIAIGYGTNENSGQGGDAVADYKNFNWDQRYTPLDRSYSAEWQYGWDSFGLDGKRTEANRFGASLGVSLATEAPQSLRFNTRLSNTKAPEGGSGATAGSLGGEHSIYLEDYVMSISTNASMSRDEIRGANSGSAISQLQVGTAMDWIPSDDYPLRIAAGARYFQLGMDIGADQNSSKSAVQTTDVNFSAIYPLDQNWNLSLSSNLLATNFSSGNTTSRTGLYSLNAGASWRGDGIIRNFENWAYAMSYGASLTAGYLGYEGDSALESGSTGVLSSSLGNSLSRNYLLVGYRNPLSLSLSQTISLTAGAGAGAANSQSVQSLNHGANIRWSPDSDGRSQTSFQVSLADGRSFGETSSYFQSVTTAADRQWILGNYQSLSGSVSVGLNQQGVNGSSDGWKGAGAANLTYGHVRFANVNGLVYSLNYGAVLKPYETLDNGRAGTKWELEHLLSQSWSWRYGLLSWKVSNNNSFGPQGASSSSLWLTVTRDFGGVL